MGQLAEIGEWEDDAWFARNEHWLARGSKPRGYRSRRERSRDPLILCGHGVTLRIEHGALVVRNGFTHYPQEREIFRFFKGDLAIPPRIIMLDGSGSLSFDVVSWLSEQNVPLFRIDWSGDIASVIGGATFAQNPERVLWQMQTRADSESRLAFCAGLIADKLRASIETLKAAVPGSNARDNAVGRIEASLSLLEAGSVRSVEEIRMVEARAAAGYFTAWRGAPIRWRSKTRFPIPDAWLTVPSRRTIKDGAATNRHARHPVNAMLNYGYAVLHANVQAELAASGYDPKLGIMHETRADAQAFVLDMMEHGRAIVDRQVLRFVFANAFSGADFVIRSDGVCRLAPQLARQIAALPVQAA
jgi:CRISPR-associated protein Cas1